MNSLTKNQEVHRNALCEFDGFVEVLRKNKIHVMVIDDQPEPHTPDSIFPNNWISTHEDGEIFLYPMQAENRRKERRFAILKQIEQVFHVKKTSDLSYFEHQGKYLEGTGSLILDRENKLAYACRSSRTHPDVLEVFCKKTGYKPVLFSSTDENGVAIYHTNVMLCIGSSFAVVCLDSIQDSAEKETVVRSLNQNGKEIIAISLEQVRHFSGNMLQLKNTSGECLLVLSEQAYQALHTRQLEKLNAHCRLLHSPLYTIESAGGGSARCMMAELFLERKQTGLASN